MSKDLNLTLESERLRLTPLTPDDIDICLEMFTDPVVVEYADGVISETEVHNEMPSWTKRGGDGGIGVWRISDHECVQKYGTIALLPMPVEKDDTDFDLVIPGSVPPGEIEIGYFLKPSAWGRGFATEACNRLLQFAFEETQLPLIVATFDEANVASKHVLEKVGFANHGTMLCYGEIGPNYRITRDEWSMKGQQSVKK